MVGMRWASLAAWIGLGLAPGLTGCDVVFGLARAPEATLAPGDWASVSAGSTHTCGIRLDGTLWCWGSDEFGQLGRGAMGGQVDAPVQIGTAHWQAVAAGPMHTCGIQDGGTLWCWGYSSDGALGLSASTLFLAPAPVLTPAVSWQRIAVGRTTSCALDTAGKLYCTGRNDYGQAGDGTTTMRTEFTPVAGTGWRSISLGIYHSCGTRVDDSLWCWGSNSYGALADPNASPSELVPHRAPGSWSEVSTGDDFTCARRTDGTLRCWGINARGALGDGTTTASKLGTVVGSNASDWTSVAAGGAFTCGLRGDGALYCWGDNQLGQIASTQVGAVASTPVEISEPAEQWDHVSVGGAHACAIDRAHRLWCTGWNGAGQLGITGALVHVPTQVPGRWHAVRAGTAFTCALDDHAEAWCWGENVHLQLGDATRLPRQVPTRISADGPWDALVAGSYHACARAGAGGAGGRTPRASSAPGTTTRCTSPSRSTMACGPGASPTTRARSPRGP